MIRVWVAVLVLSATLTLSAADTVLFADDFTNGISTTWQNLAYFKTPTEYQACHEGTNSFVRAVSDNTGLALTAKLGLVPPQKLILRWRWRIAGVNTNGSERDLKKFDHAARVFVAFDTLIPPARTINYLWGNVEPAGTALDHPKSSRAQIIVLESGNNRAGQWVSEERDVTADWRKVFPDKPMPKIVALGLMTDSDSLGQKLTGDYADIELIGE